MGRRLRPTTWILWACVFLWHAVAPGQDSLDGHRRWVRFGPGQGLPDVILSDLLDIDGRPWLALHGGVYAFDGFTWTPAAGCDVFEGTTVSSMTRGADGAVWIATADGLFRVADGVSERIDLGRHSDDRVLAVVRRPDGAPLARTISPDHERSAIVDASTGVAIDLPSAIPTSFDSVVFETPSGVVWLALDDGLYTLEGSVFSKRVAAGPDDRVQLLSIAENRRGEGVAAMRGSSRFAGVWQWDASRRPVRVATEGRGGITSVAIADDGTAVATYESGEARVRRDGRWGRFAIPPAVGVPLFAEFGTSGLWIGSTHGLHLNRALPGGWSIWRYPDVDHPHNMIHRLRLTPDGVWAASAGGLIRLGRDRGRPHLESVHSSEFDSLAVDDRGLVVAASVKRPGLTIRDEMGNWNDVSTADDGSPLGRVHALRATRDGTVWVIGHRVRGEERPAGVWRLRHGRLARWRPADDLGHVAVFDLGLFDDGSVRAVTDAALHRWDGTRWVVDFRTDSNARRLVRGAGGWWLVTQRRPALVAIERERGGISRALGGRAFLGINDVVATEDGRIWIGTGQGLFCMVRDEPPFRVDEGVSLGQLNVTALATDGTTLYVGLRGRGIRVVDLEDIDAVPPRVTGIECTADAQRALVRWHVQSYFGEIDAARTSTRFRVDGGEWSGWSAHQEHMLSGLDAGGHVVDVQARSPFGRQGPVATRGFVVTVPVHRRPGFWVGLAALAAGLLALGWQSWRRARHSAAIARKRVEELNRVFKGASDAIVTFDERGFCTAANPSAYALFGRDVVGRYLPDFFSDALPRTPVEGGEESAVVELTLADHSDRVVEASLRRLLDGRSVGIFRDLSERRRHERERLDLERRLTRAQKLESLGVMAGGVAHDFNNLLMVMMASAEELASGEFDREKARPHVERIIQAVDKSSGLTQQLLDYAGAGATEMRPVDVIRVVLDVDDLLDAAVPKTITFRRRIPDEPSVVLGDRSQLQQVVLNLVTNAAEAIEDGEGEISLSIGVFPGRTPDRLRRIVGLDPGWVWLEVSDTGVGMDEATRERIFEPFFTTKFTGRGLGLAAVQGIVAAHGGKLHVESRPGAGTNIGVALPLTREEEAKPASGGGAPTAPLRVLIVDDEPGVLQAMRITVERAGHEVELAHGGEEALDIATRPGTPFDCALVDLMMPGMSGVRTRDLLRSRCPDLPIVMMSGFSPASGPDDTESIHFLAKPFTVHTVQAALRRAVPGAAPRGAE